MTRKDMPSGMQKRKLKGRIIGIPEGELLRKQKGCCIIEQNAQCKNDGLRN
jgi:hypothetical protein